MADQNRANEDTLNAGAGTEGEVRRAEPTHAAQDPENVERQEQIRRDRDALAAQADRVEATTPPEVRDRTIGEIVDDAERQSQTDLRNP